MGVTYLTVDVANPARPEVVASVDFLIDSGATISVVPEPILRGLGIQPLSEQQFRLANGEVIRRQKGVALFKYGDRLGGSDVIFGQEGDMTLLGVLALESMGYALDPIRHELRELPMLLA